jgi:hypothetical protein
VVFKASSVASHVSNWLFVLSESWVKSSIACFRPWLELF